MAQQPARAVIVDDSALMRKKLREILEADGRVQVVATAGDGESAVRLVAELRPDVVTMDLEMPGQGGLWAIREIMRRTPVPVVVVSSLAKPQAEATIQALLAGAVACVAKPSGACSPDIEKEAEHIRREVAAALRARPRNPAPMATAPSRTRPLSATGCRRLLLVAASTGGPGALVEFFGTLPYHDDLAVLVVQHMPVGFTAALAEHLNRITPYTVREASEGDRLAGGVAFVAPAGRHLVLQPEGTLHLDSSPPEHGVRPAADVLFRSAITVSTPQAVVVLTGMGFDGAMGAKELHGRGALVLAQDAQSVVVDGMPRAVRALGIADVVGSPAELARAVAQWCSGALVRHRSTS